LIAEAPCVTRAQRAVLEHAQRLRGDRGVPLHPFPDEAHDRHAVLHLDAREGVEVGDDRVEAARVVDRERHGHLGGGDEIDRGAVRVEHGEDPREEAVRHEHARRHDVHDRDPALVAIALTANRRSFARTPSARIVVPSPSGRRAFPTHTGILASMAGRSVAGWRTFAPK
jgi:hypothetical protein